MDNDDQGWTNQLPWNPYENMPVWPLFLTKDGRATLKWMLGISPRPGEEPVYQPKLQPAACCHVGCPGLVSVDGHCFKCNQKFAALIICPSCGWKQGVLNPDKFHFRCYMCEAVVSDS